jgi:hypothetical protein
MSTRKKDKKWYRKLRVKYRLVLFNETTFEERLSFRLTRLNVISLILSLMVIFFVMTYYVIAYTSLREYIPGYPDIHQKKELYRLGRMADSLLSDIQKKNLYIENIKRIIENRDIVEKIPSPDLTAKSYDTIEDRKSPNDSLLRASFERQTRFNLNFGETGQVSFNQGQAIIQNQNFYKPLNGILTAKFNPLEKHYGVDIVASHNEAVKSVLDGTVLLSDWTLETGYILVIQHAGNLISVYKHNATLLKQEGDLVKAGEPVAIAGNSGEITTGPHLHFELWYNGNPVDPAVYINFN